MFNLAHISDPHGQSNLANAQALAQSLENTFCVCTGDISEHNYNDGVGVFNNNVFAPVVGNHDTCFSATDWSNQPTQAQLYNRFFAGSNLIEIAVNNTWWSREFAAEKVIVLGLNDAIYSADVIASEIAWLNERFDYAKNNDYGVMIMHHGFAPDAAPVDCVLTARYRIATFASEKSEYHGWYPSIYKLYNAVKAFSGKLLGLFGGHGHYDMFATLTMADGRKVPHIAIGSTIIDEYNDLSRSAGGGKISNVVLNLYRYSAKLNALEVYRLGASGSGSGDRRKMLVWDYGKQAIVSQVSAKG